MRLEMVDREHPPVLKLLPSKTFGLLMLRFCEPSHLADLRLRLPRPIHRLSRPADLAPADLDLHPRKRRVDRKIRDFPHCVPAPPAAAAPFRAAFPSSNSRSRDTSPPPRFTDDVGRRPQTRARARPLPPGGGWSERRFGVRLPGRQEHEHQRCENRSLSTARCERGGSTRTVVFTFTLVFTSLHPDLHLKNPPYGAGSRIGRLLSGIPGMFSPPRISRTPEVSSPAPAGRLSVPGNWCKLFL